MGGLNGDWLISRQQVLRDPVPGLVPARRRRAPSGTTARSPPTRRRSRSIRRRTRHRATRSPNAASPAVSPAIPTSWTPGPPRRSPRRSRAHGRTTPSSSPGSSRWTSDPRAPRSSGRGCSRRCCAASSSTARLPWSDASINGWILDPDRKKMSKSKGNVITPEALVPEHGADGVRYWACGAAPGTDTATDPAADAGRPAPGHQAAERLEVRPLDGRRRAARSPSRSTPAMLAGLREVVAGATEAFERLSVPPGARAGRDASSGRSATTTSSWSSPAPTDRRRTSIRGPTASARAALALALSVQLRLFAPFLPFVTEEVWSWWQEGSIHRARWPEVAELAGAEGRPRGARGRGRGPRASPAHEDRRQALPACPGRAARGGGRPPPTAWPRSELPSATAGKSELASSRTATGNVRGGRRWPLTARG